MSDEGFMDPGESAAMLLESMAAEGYESITPGEMLEDFVARTPMLTPGERADILEAALGREAAETNWGRIGQDVQGWSQTIGGLANLAGSIAGLFPGQAARDVQRGLQTAAGIGGTLGNITGGLMQQFGGPQQPPGRPQPGQVPPIRPSTLGGPRGPMPQRPPAPGTPPQGAPILGGVLPPGFQFPGFQPPAGQGGFQAPGGGMGGVGGSDATAMLQQLLGNPQLLQALAGGIVGGPTAAREVVLELAGSEGATEQVAIPLGAVMNAIATLATEAMIELNAQTHEAEPEVPDYLLAESGDLIVDPANAEARAALVVDYFRRAHQAEREGLVGATEDWGAFEDFAAFEGFEDDEAYESDEDDELAEWDGFED